MKPSSIIAHIRQICCLGLDGKTIMPELLTALHDWVFFSKGVFGWADAQCDVADAYFDHPWPSEVMHLYFSDFYNKREREVYPGFTELLRSGMPLHNSAVVHKKFLRSDLYDVIGRPADLGHALRVPVREGNRPLGLLFLFRPLNAAAWSHRDERRVLQVAPYIAHAVAGSPIAKPGTGLVDDEKHGLVIFDKWGEIQYLSPLGRQLLYQVAYPQLSRESLMSASLEALKERLALLRQRLTAIFRDQEALPPSFLVRTSWGALVFRGYRLEPGTDGAEALIGVTIERHVPLPLKLLLGMKSLPLSPQQREVCLLLAQGLSQPAIAQRLGLSRHTVTSNVRAIYRKLRIHSHEELFGRLVYGGEALPAGRPARH